MAYLVPRLGASRNFVPAVSVVRLLGLFAMDDMGMSASRSPLERLDFDNVVLKKLPLDPSEDPGVRQVKGACFSRVKPQPLTNPHFVAVSHKAMELLGLSGEEVMNDPLGPEYLSGSKVMPGSEPAAHCYCGHQFGQFAGQLGDGAACYLGEVKVPPGQDPELLRENPSGRWEIQVKGAGLTPYSRYYFPPVYFVSRSRVIFPLPKYTSQVLELHLSISILPSTQTKHFTIMHES